MKRLRIAIAQMNATVGDLAGNAAKILEFSVRARNAGADVLLTPELALSGYPPEDLLMRDDFYRACAAELAGLAKLAALPLIVGHPLEAEGEHFNAASLISDGKVLATYRKHRLPNYEVFDEERYFAAGREPCVVELNGVRCGLAICADVWEYGAAEAAAMAGATGSKASPVVRRNSSRCGSQRFGRGGSTASTGRGSVSSAVGVSG